MNSRERTYMVMTKLVVLAVIYLSWKATRDILETDATFVLLPILPIVLIALYAFLKIMNPTIRGWIFSTEESADFVWGVGIYRIILLDWIFVFSLLGFLDHLEWDMSKNFVLESTFAYFFYVLASGSILGKTLGMQIEKVRLKRSGKLGAGLGLLLLPCVFPVFLSTHIFWFLIMGFVLVNGVMGRAPLFEKITLHFET